MARPNIWNHMLAGGRSPKQGKKKKKKIISTLVITRKEGEKKVQSYN
jgi:hypothetical protein